MLRCFGSSSLQSSSLPPSENHCATSQDNSAADTPRSNVVFSPTVNLSREFAKAVHTSSYNEIWSKIHVVKEWENGEVNHQRQFLSQNQDTLMRPLTDEKVEEMVKQRVAKRAMVFGQNVALSDTSSNTYKVDPAVISHLHDEWVIPLTKVVKVEYLLWCLD